MNQLTSTRLRARNHNSIRGRRRLLDAEIGEELRPLASNTASELDVFGDYGDPLRVYGAEIGVLEESDEIRFRGLLERGDGGALEAEIGLEILRDLADKALEGELTDEKLGALLVLTNLPEGDRSGTEAVGFLNAAGGWSGLSGSLRSQLLPRCLSAGRFARGLLRPRHLRKRFQERGQIGFWISGDGFLRGGRGGYL
ncbi:hypothetical protein HPP92_006102 [Vanilla planifolia]|uniref:Uncharacterized protein n=1 Tax=Vanilla planifolia TaxID=51239 RepID=A0A835RP16_VANPL|nr:hypothetical protein HPP92_006102 [Vanilla planifolia]